MSAISLEMKDDGSFLFARMPLMRSCRLVWKIGSDMYMKVSDAHTRMNLKKAGELRSHQLITQDQSRMNQHCGPPSVSAWRGSWEPLGGCDVEFWKSVTRFGGRPRKEPIATAEPHYRCLSFRNEHSYGPKGAGSVGEETKALGEEPRECTGMQKEEERKEDYA
jgi:hypothetical protein